MAPFACLAIFPVSRMRERPPTSTVTWCGAGAIMFSDMSNYFLWLRVRAEHFRARSGGESSKGVRQLTALQTTLAALQPSMRKKRGEKHAEANGTRRTTPRE